MKASLRYMKWNCKGVCNMLCKCLCVCECMFMSVRVCITLCYALVCKRGWHNVKFIRLACPHAVAHIFCTDPELWAMGHYRPPTWFISLRPLVEEIHLEIALKNASQARSPSISFPKVLSFKSWWKLNEKCLQDWMDADREMITHRWSFGEPTVCLGSVLCVWGAYCVFGEPSAGLLGISPLLCDLLADDVLSAAR